MSVSFQFSTLADQGDEKVLVPQLNHERVSYSYHTRNFEASLLLNFVPQLDHDRDKPMP